MSTLGKDLKQEREMRGISLKEIADTTKINLRFLRALEEDQMDMLPGKFFTTGILKAYAEYLGMEEHTILNKFYHEEQLRKQDQSKEPEIQKDQTRASSKVKSYLAFFGMVVVLISILFVFYFIFQKKEIPVPEERIFPTAIPQNSDMVPKAIKPEFPAQYQGLTMAITFQEITWVQIFADGIKVLDGNQQPGYVFQAEAEKELLMGLRFSLNGKKGGILGKIGAIQRDIRITPENMHQFLEEDTNY